MFDDDFPYEEPKAPFDLALAAVPPGAPKLDPQQEAAAYAEPKGVVLVEAGAGSGKTSMLKYRVRYILRYRDEHFDTTSKILVLMFGKKNAGDLDAYFTETLSASDRERVVVKTFHSIAGTLLFKFRGASPVKSQIQRIKEYHLVQDYADYTRRTGSGLSNKQVKKLLWVNEEALGCGWSTEAVVKKHARHLLDKTGMTAAQVLAAVDRFDRWRCETGKLVFNDYMPLANMLPARCFKAMNYNDIIVDEVQDLNAQQRGIVKNFMAHAQSVTAVGDREQSIFGFTGADDKIFEKLRADYPDAVTLPMHFNYRSTDQILALANKVLEHDLSSPMRLKGTGRQGPPPLVYTDGARGLLAWMQMRHESGEAWKNMAILYRNKFDVAELEMTLASSGVPFVLHDGGFFEHAVVQDLVAYLNLFYHPQVAYGDWRRIFNHVRGLGDMVAEEVWKVTNGKPLDWTGDVPNAAGRQGRETAWFEFWDNLLLFKETADASVNKLVGVLVSELSPYWERIYEDASPGYLADCLRMAQVTKDWVAAFGPAVTGWDVVKAIEEVESGNRKTDPDTDAVQVMTGHKAKGLQFPSVALWGIADGKFPMNGPTSDPGEERRLGYVILTRAMNHLALICPYPKDRDSTFARHVPDARKSFADLLGLDAAS